MTECEQIVLRITEEQTSDGPLLRQVSRGDVCKKQVHPGRDPLET